jgi:iron complex outermembrane receptor protein
MTPVYLDANARVAYEPQSKRWSLALWGKNLTNNHVATTGFDIPGLGTRTIWPTPPRTYGLDFSYNFF